MGCLFVYLFVCSFVCLFVCDSKKGAPLKKHKIINDAPHHPQLYSIPSKQYDDITSRLGDRGGGGRAEIARGAGAPRGKPNGTARRALGAAIVDRAHERGVDQDGAARRPIGNDKAIGNRKGIVAQTVRQPGRHVELVDLDVDGIDDLRVAGQGQGRAHGHAGIAAHAGGLERRADQLAAGARGAKVARSPARALAPIAQLAGAARGPAAAAVVRVSLRIDARGRAVELTRAADVDANGGARVARLAFGAGDGAARRCRVLHARAARAVVGGWADRDSAHVVDVVDAVVSRVERAVGCFAFVVWGSDDEF